MSIAEMILPKDYTPKLDIMQTELAIKLIKDYFERALAEKLSLTRVSAPLFVRPESGLNDNLNGIERPVKFDLLEINADVEIVHSLAKWKRLALKRYGFSKGKGLYTDMNAIRRDENLDNLHSVYVDQWDWECVIAREQRNLCFLQDVVQKIVDALCETERKLCETFPQINRLLVEKTQFITTQQLEDLYPTLTPKQREDAICKQYGTVFIMQIGKELKSKTKHDGRAPDYDDWDLNGDLLVWYPLLDRAVELSSMGIRVDEHSLAEQLELANCSERRSLTFHSMLLHRELPLTIGGGIGQSRICMLLLEKAHIGEVQASVWSEEMNRICLENHIVLL